MSDLFAKLSKCLSKERIMTIAVSRFSILLLFVLSIVLTIWLHGVSDNRESGVKGEINRILYNIDGLDYGNGVVRHITDNIDHFLIDRNDVYSNIEDYGRLILSIDATVGVLVSGGNAHFSVDQLDLAIDDGDFSRAFSIIYTSMSSEDCLSEHLLGIISELNFDYDTASRYYSSASNSRDCSTASNIALARISYKSGDYKHAISGYERILTNSIHNGNEDLKMLTLLNLAHIYNYSAMHIESISAYSAVASIAEHSNNKAVQMLAISKIAEELSDIGKLSISTDHIENALHMTGFMNYDDHLAKIINKAASIYLEFGDYNTALSHINAAISSIEDNNGIGIAELHYTAGQVMSAIGDREKAIQHYSKSIKLLSELYEMFPDPAYLIMIGDIYMDNVIDDHKRAFSHYGRALDRSIECKNKYYEIIALYKMAINKHIDGKLDLAYELISNAIENNEQYNNVVWNKCIKCEEAEIAVEFKEYEEARLLINNLLIEAKNNNDSITIGKVLLTLSKLEQKHGNEDSYDFAIKKAEEYLSTVYNSHHTIMRNFHNDFSPDIKLKHMPELDNNDNISIENSDDLN